MDGNKSGLQSDAIDEEINAYSVLENVFYITQVADKLIETKQVPPPSRAELCALVIQLAEQVTNEHGSDASSEFVAQFAQKELKERLGA